MDHAAAPPPLLFRIAGSGVGLPSCRVTSADLDRRFGLTPGTVEHLSGVRERRHVTSESASSLAAAAARSALDQAGWQPGDVEFLVSASSSFEQPIPCSAALFARELGVEGVGCADVDATCLSFLVALWMVIPAFATRQFRRALVISSEVASPGLDWDQPETASLFGDGAVAFCLEASSAASQDLAPQPDMPGGTWRLRGASLKTWPQGADICHIRGGGSRLHAGLHTDANHKEYLFGMDGPALFREVANRLPAFLTSLLAQAGTTADRLDWIVPHQASGGALDRMTRRLGFAPGRMLRIIEDVGNCVAASIPMTLHEALRSDRIEPGHTVLLLGTSAGVTLGGMVLNRVT